MLINSRRNYFKKHLLHNSEVLYFTSLEPAILHVAFGSNEASIKKIIPTAKQQGTNYERYYTKGSNDLKLMPKCYVIDSTNAAKIKIVCHTFFDITFIKHAIESTPITSKNMQTAATNPKKVGLHKIEFLSSPSHIIPQKKIAYAINNTAIDNLYNTAVAAVSSWSNFSSALAQKIIFFSCTSFP